MPADWGNSMGATTGPDNSEPRCMSASKMPADWGNTLGATFGTDTLIDLLRDTNSGIWYSF